MKKTSITIARRLFLKRTLLSSLTAAIATLLPRMTFADFPKTTAFGAKTAKEAMKALFGEATMVEGDKQIVVNAPDIAENGSAVNVEVTTTLPKVESITLIASKNPTPLIAHFKLSDNFQGFLATRVKMAETSRVIVIVKAEDKLYTIHKEVKITIGGCGG